MNSFLLIQIDEVDRKMHGYTMLLSYRYMNLCVKMTFKISLKR